jgi:hypothetical protein
MRFFVLRGRRMDKEPYSKINICKSTVGKKQRHQFFKLSREKIASLVAKISAL